MCLPIQNLEERTLAKGEHLGFEWQIVHNGNGYRCGYVKVLPGHPWFGKNAYCGVKGHYDGVEHDCREIQDMPSVHGGITFAKHGKARPTHDEEAEWWVGFDCAHSFDAPDPELAFVAPARSRVFRELSDALDGLPSGYKQVRSQEYVEAECRELAEQAYAASH